MMIPAHKRRVMIFGGAWLGCSLVLIAGYAFLSRPLSQSIQGVTIPDEDFRDWMLKLLGAISDLGGIGPMTLQAFLTGEGDPVFSEVNPRFGGGFPLGHAAGGRYPEWILRMLDGEPAIDPTIELPDGLRVQVLDVTCRSHRFVLICQATDGESTDTGNPGPAQEAGTDESADN